ncbi:MAG: SDR family oxidoreductase [Salinivirgaceae bacterium]|jgi:UDP-N-acetylglucosamine 4-epimerase|nr:SDR family oxidoreductase [Salinivirgaceae bacterium]
MNQEKRKQILITGGAGFIGSNLCDALIEKGHQVVCLDNFSTGKRKNIVHLFSHPNFKLIEGDIRNITDCMNAVEGCDYVLHEAALGSVPRSIKDPITSNEVNIGGFLNMLVAARDANVKRFIYAASSSTYGDSPVLPKVEDKIGKPLSPYAITKYVNELYADVFSKTYQMECVGLRYFNVFGKRQDPNGAYAAVIPLWVKQMIKLESPIINGNGEFSRDFTYVENVIQANQKAMFALTENLKTAEGHVNQVFNVAYGGNTTLIELFKTLKENLAKFSPEISRLEPSFGPYRSGDIPHSQASIEKAKHLINYQPKYSAQSGFELACEWYWNNLK